MKIDVEIITGFLGSGKTTFINALINETKILRENILVIQFERGKNTIENNENIKVIQLDSVFHLKNTLLSQINNNQINRIIIEYNGTEKLENIIDILKEKKYKEVVKISTIYFVADGKNLNEYMDNVGGFLVPFVRSCNMVLINNVDDSNKDNLAQGLKKIKSLNPKVFILQVPNKYILNTKLKESNVLDKGILKKLKVKIMNSKMHRKEE